MAEVWEAMILGAVLGASFVIAGIICWALLLALFPVVEATRAEEQAVGLAELPQEGRPNGGTPKW